MEPNLAEAERRIEEARTTGAESLDLGDLALIELPASLGGLPRLKALYLGSVYPKETGGLVVPSTHGVQIWREELRVRTGDQDQTFQGIPLRNQPLAYWLDYANSRR